MNLGRWINKGEKTRELFSFDNPYYLLYSFSMQATTIKLEGEILKELRPFIPAQQSLSAFVREVLEQEIKKRKMVQSAEEYSHFLESHPEEKNWLQAWEKASLETSHSQKGKHS